MSKIISLHKWKWGYNAAYSDTEDDEKIVLKEKPLSKKNVFE